MLELAKKSVNLKRKALREGQTETHSKRREEEKTNFAGFDDVKGERQQRRGHVYKGCSSQVCGCLACSEPECLGRRLIRCRKSSPTLFPQVAACKIQQVVRGYLTRRRVRRLQAKPRACSFLHRFFACNSSRETSRLCYPSSWCCACRPALARQADMMPGPIVTS